VVESGMWGGGRVVVSGVGKNGWDIERGEEKVGG